MVRSGIRVMLLFWPRPRTEGREVNLFKIPFAVALLALPLLAACVSAGSLYKPAPDSKSVGYTDTKINSTLYRVRFMAQNTVSRTDVDNLALLRAAELTVANGHSWFMVARRTFAKVEVGQPRMQVTGTTRKNLVCDNAGILECNYEPDEGRAIAGVEVGMAGAYETRQVETIDFAMGDGALPSGEQVYAAAATAAKIRALLGKE